jgi:hypothetical protein
MYNVQAYQLRGTYTALYLLCFALIRWGASHIQFFFFGNEPIWFAHHSKKTKLWLLSKIKGSIWKYGNPCLGGQHLPKDMGKNWSAIGNSLGNMSVTWELFALNPPPLYLASLDGRFPNHISWKTAPQSNDLWVLWMTS